MKRKAIFWLGAVIVVVGVTAWVMVSDSGCPADSSSVPARANQGCVNQGADCRVAGTVVCWLQRQLSWKSEQTPHLVRIGPKRRAHLAFAWPPYVVYNVPQGDGRWRVIRLGFRYDRNWHGYIFPTAAWKYMGAALEY